MGWLNYSGDGFIIIWQQMAIIIFNALVDCFQWILAVDPTPCGTLVPFDSLVRFGWA